MACNNDIRNIANGYTVRSDGYSDQPYVVKTDDGHWLMCLTVSSGEEGSQGQHVVSLRSNDCGKTWGDVVDVSSPELPESSYSVLYKTTYGRIYCFYNFNADNTRGVLWEHPDFPDGLCPRVDTQGHFVFKYSDDHGKTWSEKWYDIPMRDFEVDRLNPYGGKIKYFWNVGKPLELETGVLVPIYKIREFGLTFMEHSEGALLECCNLNTEKDPEKLIWQTLPDGDIGIRAPKDISIISEEHSFVKLSDGTVFVVFRTVCGHPYCSYSRDNCHTFSEPQPMKYADGRLIKHPRAANFIWKCSNGKYVYWFHNHSGKGYMDRNPTFLLGAWEIDTPEGKALEFGQPQVALYDEDTSVRMSYPDFIEEDGEYYITETQKTISRVHKLSKELVESLWEKDVAENGWEKIEDKMPEAQKLLGKDASFSLRFEINKDCGEGVVFSTMDKNRGLEITRQKDGALKLLACDGQRMSVFLNDDGILNDDKTHTVTAVFDAGVCAVYFVTDGRFCDGGEKRQFGFTRFDRQMTSVAGLEAPAVNKLINLRFKEGIHLYD